MMKELLIEMLPAGTLERTIKELKNKKTKQKIGVKKLKLVKENLITRVLADEKVTKISDRGIIEEVIIPSMLEHSHKDLMKTGKALSDPL